MTQSPYTPERVRQLVKRTEYESWLLEAVYSLVEQELFPNSPDAVIYMMDGSGPEFFAHARAGIVIGDWRPGFLNAGAPLIFIATFKLLDMLIEWVLEANGFKQTFQFKEKLKRLDGGTSFPEIIESRSWLKERLVGLYRTLEPLRGTIIHDRHFMSSDGTIQVSSSKKGVVGPPVAIGAAELRQLALTVVSIVRYIDGTWRLDPYREKVLRHHLDGIAHLHGLPSVAQRQPYYPTVRVFSTYADLRTIDPKTVHDDLMARYSNNDCMFDLRILVIDQGSVVDAFLLPWTTLDISQGRPRNDIHYEDYRVQIPDDIDPKHLAPPD